jgi:hypothetical protein
MLKIISRSTCWSCRNNFCCWCWCWHIRSRRFWICPCGWFVIEFSILFVKMCLHSKLIFICNDMSNALLLYKYFILLVPILINYIVKSLINGVFRIPRPHFLIICTCEDKEFGFFQSYILWCRYVG